MKGKIIRAYTTEYAEIAAVTYPGIQLLAMANGFTLTEHLIEKDPIRHPSWSKLGFIIKELADDPKTPVYWMDVDIAIADKPTQHLEYINVDGLRFSQDSNGICAGFFAAKGMWALDFLICVDSLGDTRANPSRQEQDAIKALAVSFPAVESHIEKYATSTITCPELEPGSGTIAHHFWANGWTDKKALAEHIRAWLKARALP